MRVISLVALLLMSISLFAQDDIEKNKFSIGLTFGGGYSSYTKPIYKDGFISGNSTINGGLGIMVPITSRRVSLVSELVYANRSFGDGEMHGTTYRVDYLEMPVLVNVRLFGKYTNLGFQTFNLVAGVGGCKAQKSAAATDSAEEVEGLSDWYRYAQEHTLFEKPEKYNSYLIIGANTNIINGCLVSIGIRGAYMLKSIYEKNEAATDYNLDTKAFSVTLQLGVYL